MKSIHLTKAPLVETVENSSPEQAMNDEILEDVLDEESYVLMTPKPVKIKLKIRSVKKAELRIVNPDILIE